MKRIAGKSSLLEAAARLAFFSLSFFSKSEEQHVLNSISDSQQKVLGLSPAVFYRPKRPKKCLSRQKTRERDTHTHIHSERVELQKHVFRCLPTDSLTKNTRKTMKKRQNKSEKKPKKKNNSDVSVAASVLAIKPYGQRSNRPHICSVCRSVSLSLTLSITFSASFSLSL